jgi:tetratricopeptide (TPR) repeat protein
MLRRRCRCGSDRLSSVSQVDDAAAQRELNAALERFRGDPRAALRLGPADDAAAARRAFMALCKVYHPAKFARHEPPIVKLCNEVFLQIRRCYEATAGANATHPARPAAAAPPPPPSPPPRPPSGMPAMKALQAPPPARTTAPPRATPAGGVPITHPNATPPRLAPMPPPPEATLFEKGLEYTRAGRWPEARAAFGDLAARHPTDSRYRAYLHYARGWEAFGGGKAGEARAEWQRALACDPSNNLARQALESTGLAK